MSQKKFKIFLKYTLLVHVATCIDPGKPAHSLRIVDQVLGFREDAEVRYSCNTGYEMSPAGDSYSLRCGSDGLWNSSLPECNSQSYTVIYCKE